MMLCLSGVRHSCTGLAARLAATVRIAIIGPLPGRIQTAGPCAQQQGPASHCPSTGATLHTNRRHPALNRVLVP